MSKGIWILYSCDGWKSTNSMRVLGAATTVLRLKRMVKKAIQKQVLIYNDGITRTTTKQVKCFQEEFDVLSMKTINDRLLYGFFELRGDGETTGTC